MRSDHLDRSLVPVGQKLSAGGLAAYQHFTRNLHMIADTEGEAVRRALGDLAPPPGSS